VSERKTTGAAARRDLCPAPGCWEPVLTDPVHDRRERAWHRGCALRALSDHFRTPPDLEALAGERVEFDVPGEHARVDVRGDLASAVFRAPRDFVLRAVVLGGDVGLHAMFVGAENALCQAPVGENAVRAGDLEGGVLAMAPSRVLTGMDVTLHYLLDRPPSPPAPVKLVGELVDSRPRGRPPSLGPRQPPVCHGFGSHEPVPAGETVEVRLCGIFTATTFERVSADDWRDWTVERVKVSGFAGAAADEVAARLDRAVGRPLSGRTTSLPTFVARPGEWVGLVVRNRAPAARKLNGRLYGTASYGPEPEKTAL
jgi:hypothetical protein